MAKFELDLKNVIVNIDDKLVKRNGNKITDEIVEALFKSLNDLPIETKSKMINKVYTLSDDILDVNDVKIGSIVESVTSGRAGMIIKINPKSIVVAFKNGVVNGPITAFKKSSKTVDDLKAERSYFTFDTSSVGSFVQVLIGKKDNKVWKSGIVSSNSREKVRIEFYETDTYITITEQQARNNSLVKLDGGTLKQPIEVTIEEAKKNSK